MRDFLTVQINIRANFANDNHAHAAGRSADTVRNGDNTTTNSAELLHEAADTIDAMRQGKAQAPATLNRLCGRLRATATAALRGQAQ